MTVGITTQDNLHLRRNFRRWKSAEHICDRIASLLGAGALACTAVFVFRTVLGQAGLTDWGLIDLPSRLTAPILLLILYLVFHTFHTGVFFKNGTCSATLGAFATLHCGTKNTLADLCDECSSCPIDQVQWNNYTRSRDSYTAIDRLGKRLRDIIRWITKTKV